MNEQTGFELAAPVAAKARPRVALLVDGDNISHSLAGPLIMRAIRHGDLTIKRVYGNFTSLPGWSEAPGFRSVHAGIGKNAADVLLCIEAMAVMLKGQADVLVIATSDGDFGHLALNLAEQGHKVVGLGESKAPEKFRKACTVFQEVGMPAIPEKVAQEKPAPKLPEKLSAEKPAPKMSNDQLVKNFVRAENDPNGCLITSLSTYMHKAHGVKISSLPDKTWRAFLLARPQNFVCDPRGPEARVRVKT